jgi:hypothetical protein
MVTVFLWTYAIRSGIFSPKVNFVLGSLIVGQVFLAVLFFGPGFFS